MFLESKLFSQRLKKLNNTILDGAQDRILIISLSLNAEMAKQTFTINLRKNPVQRANRIEFPVSNRVKMNNLAKANVNQCAVISLLIWLVYPANHIYIYVLLGFCKTLIAIGIIFF